MNDNLLVIVKQIVVEQGEGILSEPRRVSAFFADLARDIPKPQKNAFVKCLECQSAQILKNVAEPDRETCKQRLAQKLHEEEGLDPVLCRETIELLAAVLFGEEQKKAYCKNCGKELQEEWKFCPYCSTPAAGQAKSAVSSGAGSGGQAVSSPAGLQLIHTFKGHVWPVNSVAFSHDGKYIISGSNDDTIKLWGAESGQLIRTFKGHEGSVNSVAFSHYGKYIVSGSNDDTVKLWGAESGQLIRTFKGHEGRVNSVAFSPDGRYIISGSSDKTIKLWGVESGLLIRTFEGHYYGVNPVAYSPDGKYIVSGSSDNTIKLWDVGSGLLIRTLKGHEGWVYSVAYSPDGKYIASGSGDKTVKLWGSGA